MGRRTDGRLLETDRSDAVLNRGAMELLGATEPPGAMEEPGTTEGPGTTEPPEATEPPGARGRERSSSWAFRHLDFVLWLPEL